MWPAFALMCWNGLSALRGAILGGISWDEPNHVFMLQGWFETGYYAEAAFAKTEPERVLVFGPVSDLIGHMVAVILRVEAWGSPTLSAPSYFARHLATALVGLIAVAAVVATGRLILGSWRWGILAGATLSSIPMWTGLSMFDHKDIGSATGLMVFALGLILLLWREQTLIGLWSAAAGVLMSAGVVLSVGTRISMIVPIALSAVVALSVALVCSIRRSTLRSALTSFLLWIVVIVTSLAVAYGLLFLIYPLVFANPFDSLALSVQQSSNFQIYPYRPPRSYVIEWFFIQTPFIITVFAVVGTAISIRLVVRGVFSRRLATFSAVPLAGLSVILINAFAVPLYVIIVNSILYHSIRHLLFIYPAVALLATFGVWGLLTIGVRLRDAQWKPFANLILITALVGMLIPTIDQTRLFPYAYAYFNPIARVIGIEGRWPTDYWRTSWRELYTRVSTNEFAVCPDSILFEDNIASGWPIDQSFSCEYETKVNPFFTEAPEYNSDTGRFWFLRENSGAIYVPENCALYDRVARPLGFGTITLSYLGYCEYVPSPE